MKKTGLRERLRGLKKSLKSPERSPNKSPLSSPNQSYASFTSSLAKPNPQQPTCLPSPTQQPAASNLWDEAIRKVNNETHKNGFKTTDSIQWSRQS
ncbi:hypothetical protein GGI35DRAFT_458217 [Trichoderma velutinum]